MVETITDFNLFYNPRFKPWAIKIILLHNRFNGLQFLPPVLTILFTPEING